MGVLSYFSVFPLLLSNGILGNIVTLTVEIEDVMPLKYKLL